MASPPVIQLFFPFVFLISINDLLYAILLVSFFDLFRVILIHFYVNYIFILASSEIYNF